MRLITLVVWQVSNVTRVHLPVEVTQWYHSNVVVKPRSQFKNNYFTEMCSGYEFCAESHPHESSVNVPFARVEGS